MAAIQLGELFMIPIGDRDTVMKESLTTTNSWGLVDFSDELPAGTTAVMIAVDFCNTDGRHIVSFSEDNTTKTPQQAYHSGVIDEHAVLAGNNRLNTHMTVIAPGGKFYIAEYDPYTWDTKDGSGNITVLGYYMPVAQPLTWRY